MIEEAYLRRRPQHRPLLSEQRRHARYAVRVSGHQMSQLGQMRKAHSEQMLSALRPIADVARCG